MGEGQSCLRNTNSQSSLDMAKEVRSSSQRGSLRDPQRTGSKVRPRDPSDLKEDDSDDFLKSKRSPSRSRSRSLSEAGVHETPRNATGKKRSVDQFDWSVPQRFPRGAGDEIFPKPKLLSHTARRERLEELKRLNQQLKSSPRTGPPPAKKFQPAKRAAPADLGKPPEVSDRPKQLVPVKRVSYAEPVESSVVSKKPSLLELEVQALASLGFVKLQPDIAVDRGSLETKQHSIVLEPGTSRGGTCEIFDLRPASPSSIKASPAPRDSGREDLLELEKAALRNMKTQAGTISSSKDVRIGSDILKLQQDVQTTLNMGQGKRSVSQVLFRPAVSQADCEAAEGKLLELQTKSLSRRPCPLHSESSESAESSSQEIVEVEYSSLAPVRAFASKPPLPPPFRSPTGKRNVKEAENMAQPLRSCKLHRNISSPSGLSLCPSGESSSSNIPQQPTQKCLIHPSRTPIHLEKLSEVGSSALTGTLPSQEPSASVGLKSESDLLGLEKTLFRSRKEKPVIQTLASSMDPSSGAYVMPPQHNETNRGDLLELEKVALASMKKTHASSSGQPGPPSLNIHGEASPEVTPEQEALPYTPKALSLPSRSTATAGAPKGSDPCPTPSVTSKLVLADSGDLLELQKVALANMKEIVITPDSQSTALTAVSAMLKPVVTPPKVNGSAGAASELSELLELQKVALYSMKGVHFTCSPKVVEVESLHPPPSKSAAPKPVLSERDDFLELEKQAMANMQEVFTSASSQAVGGAESNPSVEPKVKKSKEPCFIGTLEHAGKSQMENEKGDLLELQRMALASMEVGGGEWDLKLEASTIGKEELRSSVATPRSSCSSFHLEPASGPLETMLQELTAKDKALKTAKKKLAEKEQLLYEYEGELSNALKMLESMNNRCSDAKEETSRALSEAKHIYDELSQAWSAVVDMENTSKNGIAVLSEKVNPECNKKIFQNEENKVGNEENKPGIKEFAHELDTVELAHSEVQEAFELQIQKNEMVIVELQHIREIPSADRMFELCKGHTDDVHELTCQHEQESDHTFPENISASKTHSHFHPQGLEFANGHLMLELTRMKFNGLENQELFQEQMERNEIVLAQLQELQKWYEEAKQQDFMASEQRRKWEAEEAQLNAHISALHEALEELHEALYDKTKEAEALNEQTLHYQRSLIEQEQRLIKALEHQEVDSSPKPKLAAFDFNGNTNELEADFCPSCSIPAVESNFVGQNSDHQSFVCFSCSVADVEYICTNCSPERDGRELSSAIKILPAIKPVSADFQCDTRDLENIKPKRDFQGDTYELELQKVVYIQDFKGDTHELELQNAVSTHDFEGDTHELELHNVVSTHDFEGDTSELESQSVVHTKDFEGDTLDLELQKVIQTMDFNGDTRDLELQNTICTIDFECDTRELEKIVHEDFRVDISVQVKRDDEEKWRLAQERENWERERKELIKRLDDFEASLLAKEETVETLINKLEKDRPSWQEERYQLIKRNEECETRLLSREEEVIELSTQLEMAKSTLQGFTYSDGSTVISTSSDVGRQGQKSGLHPTSSRQGVTEARELLDLRCEILSLKECVAIKSEALKAMENELSRSYVIISDLRTKFARALESERSLQSQNSNHRLVTEESQPNWTVSSQKHRGKVVKKPRLHREFGQVITGPLQNFNQTDHELLEKLRVQKEKLVALKKEHAAMSKKYEELTAKCRYLEGIEKMYKEKQLQDPMKEEAILELEKELERNVEIIQKMQQRCTEFESKASEAENRLQRMLSNDNGMVLTETRKREKAAWQAEKEALLAGLNYFRELCEKKDEELHEIRYQSRPHKQKKIKTPQTPPFDCKSSLPIEYPDSNKAPIVEVVVPHDGNSSGSSDQQLTCVNPSTAAILEYEPRPNYHNISCDSKEKNEATSSQISHVRELTSHLKEQWELQCSMEERLDTMMTYVSNRVKEFEGQNQDNTQAGSNFVEFYKEATLMKSQLEQQLQLLRGSLSASFHKLDEAKRQLQSQAVDGKEIQPVDASYETVRREPESTTIADCRDKAIQLVDEKVELEDSAQTLEEKTSRLLYRLTSTRLQWNMNMLSASMAAG
ncbi:hypothetical protein R1sor_005428 [Riccia sorocarpa]|uniref:Uncharacterized protein n=1 Tax=Riccia sorocarpa TaxID=122646 RepID=A0ABD3HMI6_9MARC